MQNNKIDWKRAIILGGAFMATCIGSGFATGSEFLSFFVAHGIPGAIGAIAISLIIYFLFTKELFNKGQEVSEADQHNILAYYFGKIAGERAATETRGSQEYVPYTGTGLDNYKD